MGRLFNQPLLPGSLPSSLTHLRLTNRFNQPLEVGSVPEGVRHLSMGKYFDQPLQPGALPSTLRDLTMSWDIQPASAARLAAAWAGGADVPHPVPPCAGAGRRSVHCAAPRPGALVSRGDPARRRACVRALGEAASELQRSRGWPAVSRH